MKVDVRAVPPAKEVRRNSLPVASSAEAAPVCTSPNVRSGSPASTELGLLFDASPLPMWVYCFDSLSLLAVNDAAVDLYGYPRDEFLSMTLPEIRPVEDRVAAAAAIRGGKGNFSRADRQWRHLTKNGRILQVEVTSHPLPQLGPTTGLAIIHDVTDRLESLEQLNHIISSVRCLLWHALVVQHGDGFKWEISVVDEEAALRFLPIPMKPGQFYADAWYSSKLDEEKERMDHTSLTAIAAGEPGYSVEYRCRRADGEIRWMHEDVRIQALGSQSWRLVGVVTDVTDSRRAEEELRKGDQRLRMALQAGGMGTWDLDVLTGEALWSPEMEKLCGLDTGSFPGSFDAFLGMVHADDRARIEQHMRDVGRSGAGFSCEYRIIRSDGEVRWQTAWGIALRNEEGRPERVLGVTKDITDRKQTAEKMEHQLQQLTALRAIDVAITSSLDLNLTLDMLLAKTAELLGVDAASVLRLNPHALTLEFCLGRGFRGSGFRSRRVRLGEGMAGRAALKRRMEAVPSLEQAAEPIVHRDQFVSEGFRSYYAVPLISKGTVQGVLEVFFRRPFSADPEWLEFLQTLAGQAAIAIDSAALFEELQCSNTELALAYDATIEGWSRALDLRDQETEGHTQRVTELTVALARAAGHSEEELVHIRRGALLHDIGKMGIPDEILLKPGKLTDEEWVIMKKHPVYAYELLTSISFLRPALDIPYYHHEKWDGTGYPHGLKGEQIPLSARLFAVVDVWDALSSDRPYRKAWPQERVIDHLLQGTGSHFDPAAVDAFMKLAEAQCGIGGPIARAA